MNGLFYVKIDIALIPNQGKSNLALYIYNITHDLIESNLFQIDLLNSLHMKMRSSRVQWDMRVTFIKIT